MQGPRWEDIPKRDLLCGLSLLRQKDTCSEGPLEVVFAHSHPWGTPATLLEEQLLSSPFLPLHPTPQQPHLLCKSSRCISGAQWTRRDTQVNFRQCGRQWLEIRGQRALPGPLKIRELSPQPLGLAWVRNLPHLFPALQFSPLPPLPQPLPLPPAKAS